MVPGPRPVRHRTKPPPGQGVRGPWQIRPPHAQANLTSWPEQGCCTLQGDCRRPEAPGGDHVEGTSEITSTGDLRPCSPNGDSIDESETSDRATEEVGPSLPGLHQHPAGVRIGKRQRQGRQSPTTAEIADPSLQIRRQTEKKPGGLDELGVQATG